MRIRRLVAGGLLLGLVLGNGSLPVAGAAGVGSGPALESDPVALETALSCPDGLARPVHPVVLLVHGTATTAEESWPAGMGVVLHRAGFDWCMVQLPGRALVDIQRSTEYVVDAVRSIHRRTGRRVSMIGHSQGALQVRWAVRWWPDVQAVVDDAITAAGANRPIPWTKTAFCGRSCAEPIWQFSTGAAFMEAVNKVPAPEGPSYTAVRSLTDELIQPAMPESSAVATIDGATNLVIQDVCPGRTVSHVGLVFDAVFAAMVLDALHHAGPADKGRIDHGTCARPYPEGVDPVFASVNITTLYANAYPAAFNAPKADREPPLRSYAR
jgi:triacylglycerol lipase